MNCCRQIGAKAMTCECTDDYVGRNCEIHLLNTMEGKYSYITVQRIARSVID